MKKTIYQHKNNVNDMRFSDNNEYFLTVSKDRTLALYNT
jgi:WD40 repeat protein